MELPQTPYSGDRASIIGEGAELPRVAIREFKYLDIIGPYKENYSKVSSTIQNFLYTSMAAVKAEIWNDDSREFDRSSQYNTIEPSINGHHIITKLRKHLISPSIVTGDVNQLDLLSAEEEAIPKSMLTAFNRFNTSSRSHELIEGYDQLYIFAGQLKMGRELATVACGMCVTPYIEASYVSPARQLSFRYQIANFAKRDREDIRVWQNSIAESRAREGHAATHPLRGGLVNPK